MYEGCGALMPKIKHELRHLICIYLMSNGTAGWRQVDVMDKFRHYAKDEVMMELEALWAEEKVQRFTLGPKHVIWRATDKMNV
jgi:hypothetical protein